MRMCISDFVRVRGRIFPANLVRSCGLLAFALSALGGCSAAIPLPSLLSRDETPTGSIPSASAALSPALDQEDWRRAAAAMGVALDPQGAGAAARWENSLTGASGTFTPRGAAFAAGDRICRPVLAEVGGSAPTQRKQGLGCRDKDGVWTLSDVKPVAKA